MNHDPAPVPRLVGRINMEDFACDVCGNIPDKEGVIEHGRGCYVVSEDGGGITFVELPPNIKDQPAGRSAMNNETNPNPAPLRRLVGWIVGPVGASMIMRILYVVFVFISFASIATCVRLITDHPAWISYLWGIPTNLVAIHLWNHLYPSNVRDHRAGEDKP